MSESKSTRWGGWLLGLLGVWLAGVTIASWLKGFDTTGVPVAVGLAVVVPVVVFLVWFRMSRGFREYLLSLDPAMITASHAWRIEGSVFLVLWAVGRLPGTFALPAGIGDMAIGLTAPLVARAISRGKLKISSPVFVGWQVLGITDLVVAVGTAVLSSDSRIGVLAHGVTTRIMGLLPMSLIPTFAVPLLVILHLVCLAQARANVGSPRLSAMREEVAS